MPGQKYSARHYFLVMKDVEIITGVMLPDFTSVFYPVPAVSNATPRPDVNSYLLVFLE